MFRSSFTLFIVVFLLLYGLLNFWIGLRGWQFVGRQIPLLNSKIYWLAFWLVALSYFAGRFGRDFLPAGVAQSLTLIGSYWLGFMTYFTLTLVVVEIVRLAGRLAGVLPPGAVPDPRLSLALGLTVVVAVTGIMAYGWWNARHPQVVRYNINIPKQAGEIKKIRLVAVSDLHLGVVVHNGRLTGLVDTVAGLEPDLLLLPGDIIDENPGPFVDQDMMATFRRLAPTYGIYAVTGNHEYIGRKSEEIIGLLEDAGVTVLRDRQVKIAGSFYLVGVDDRSRRHFGAEGGGPGLGELMKEVDKSLPVIMLDHQPTQLAEARDNGVDLKISGHTHRGQLFPFNLITGKIYEIDWGHLQKDSLQVIVSSGFGTWGPPVRVGNRPEIVLVDLTFGSQ